MGPNKTVLQPNKNVTEWEITKTKVGNEMEIFITLKNTILACSMKKVTTARGNDIISIFSPPHNSVQCIHEELDIMFIGRVYNKQVI